MKMAHPSSGVNRPIFEDQEFLAGLERSAVYSGRNQVSRKSDAVSELASDGELGDERDRHQLHDLVSQKYPNWVLGANNGASLMAACCLPAMNTPRRSWYRANAAS